MWIVVLLAAGAALGLVLWLGRQHRPAGPPPDLPGASAEVQRAAARFGFRPQPGQDPAEAIGDARLAAMGVVVAMAELDGPLGKDEILQIVVEAQVTFGVDRRAAEEMVAFGRWVAPRCGPRHEAIRRLAKAVARLAGDAAAPDLMRMAEAAATHARPLDPAAERALDLVRRAFTVKV